MLSARRFIGEQRSVAALEFALILPIMLVLLAGVYDITEALIVDNTVSDIANNVVASASIVAEQTGENMQNATALSYDQVQQVESTIWADFPDLRRGQKNGTKSVTLSSIDFQPGCNSGSNCSQYFAYVVWSEAYTGPPGVTTPQATFAQNLRPCSYLGGSQLGADNQVPAGTPLTMSDFTYTLPTLSVSTAANDETGPTPILVADVTFSYTPLFNFYIKSNINFLATALWPIRSAKNVATATQGTGASERYYLPLSQEFTTIMGEVTNNTLTLYSPGASGGLAPTIESDAPTVSVGQGAGTASNSNGAFFCVNTYLTTPYPPAYSTPPTTS
jgi:hypothetical protein